MPEIDSLQIKISADAQKASTSIARLSNSFEQLGRSVNSIDTGKFQLIAQSISGLTGSMKLFSESVKTADFTRISTGLNKISSINVQGVSDASKAIDLLAINLSKINNIPFDSRGIYNIANAIGTLGRKTVTQAVANIPSLVAPLQSLVNGLNSVGKVEFDISGLTQLASSISKLGSKSATAAAGGNIEKLAVALKQMMITLTSAPKVSSNLIEMTQALAQLASAGNRAGSATNSLSRSFSLLPSSTQKANKSFKGLSSAIGKFYATYWLLIRAMGSFKKAIDISSDLTEVQNVVDVSFGSMSDKMNEFADSALELYGMSELTAKQIGSRFQAMGVSMGFSQEAMSDMSIRLTQLAGDLASFYNITQDEAATKLQSIFTGESEPLRALGIDLAQTSVEAWALSQGIDADMRSMTSAEKTMLRYQYVLASTGQATGDFQRTTGTWANQLRLLTGNFEQLGSIVGGVLINAFKPFIQALNSVMQAVINFAQVVSDALGAIFGWEYQTGGGVAQDLEAGAAAAEDIEDATGGAADNAKKLKSYTIGIDELHILEPDDGSGSGGGGGGAGGAGAGAGASGGEWVQTESLWEKYTSSIDSLYKLGDYIGKTLTDAMNSIDWDSVYESARNFGAGLASFLNGLISPELFGALGTTIAGALNTALYALNSFGTTFEWTEFGISIATGINNFFSTFDFANLADTIDVWANGILDALLAEIDKVDWKKVGTQIGTFLGKIDFTGIGSKVAQLAWKAIGAALETWGGSFTAAPIETALATAVAALKFTPLGKMVATKIATSIAAQFGSSAVKTIISAGFKALFGSEAAQSALVFMFPNAAQVISTVQKFFTATLIPAISNGITGTLIPMLGTAISGIGTTILSVISSLASTLGVSVAAAGGIVIAAVAAVVAGVIYTVTHWEEVKEFWTVKVPEFFTGTVIPFFQSIPEKITEIWDNLKTFTTEKWDALIEYLSEVPGKIGKVIEDIGKWFSSLPDKIGYALGYALGTIASWTVQVWDYWSEEIPRIINDVVEWFSELPGKIYNAIITFLENLKTWATNTYNVFQTEVTNIIASIVQWFSELPGKIYNAIITFISNVQQWATETYNTFNQKINEIIFNVVTWFSQMPGKIYDEIVKFVNNIEQWKNDAIEAFREKIPEIIDKVVEFFGDLPDKMLDIGDNIVKGLWNGINGAVGWLKEKISGFADSILEGFEDAFDINSPSKVFAQEGKYLVQGLNMGIDDNSDSTMDSIGNLANGIKRKIRSGINGVQIAPNYSYSLAGAYGGISGLTLQSGIDDNLYAKRGVGKEIIAELIAFLSSENSERNDLLREISEKDVNINLDGRKVNQALNSRAARSGYSIRKN